MNFAVSPEQIASYRRDGFVVHRDLLAPGELAELRGAVDEAVATLGKRRVAGSDTAWEEGTGDSY